MTRQDSNDTFVDTKTPYISRIIEQKSGRLDLNNKSSGANNNNKVVVDVSIFTYHKYIELLKYITIIIHIIDNRHKN